jgi:hypothetical protein
MSIPAPGPFHMFQTLLVFVHLIATCAAVGTILLTDLRLIARAMGYRVVIALTLLYLSGAAIVMMGAQETPGYLDNPKLHAKLVLVAILTLNAFCLHRLVFPILGRSRPVSLWSRSDWLLVAASVSLSNSMWFFCAFLGVARVWNGAVSLAFVLTLALIVWTAVFLATNVLLLLASRDQPKSRPDWIDSMKASLSDFSELRDR